jgi:hypothetical protein
MGHNCTQSNSTGHMPEGHYIRHRTHPALRGQIIHHRLLSPQTPKDHSYACKELPRLTKTLPRHTTILGGDLEGNWIRPNPKDDIIRKLQYQRWDGPSTPTFLPPSKHDHATCTDHLAIWDPHGLTNQIGPTQTVATSIQTSTTGSVSPCYNNWIPHA